MDFDDLSKKTIDIAAVAADKAKDVAFLAADKAKDVAKLTKISVAIAGEQREIDKTYRTIGEWFVNEYEGEIPDGVRELVEAVNAAKARIAELRPANPPRATRPERPSSCRRRRASAPAPSAVPPLTASSAPTAAPPWASDLRRPRRKSARPDGRALCRPQGRCFSCPEVLFRRCSRRRSTAFSPFQ